MDPLQDEELHFVDWIDVPAAPAEKERSGSQKWREQWRSQSQHGTGGRQPDMYKCRVWFIFLKFLRVERADGRRREPKPIRFILVLAALHWTDRDRRCQSVTMQMNESERLSELSQTT